MSRGLKPAGKEALADLLSDLHKRGIAELQTKGLRGRRARDDAGYLQGNSRPRLSAYP
jgi:hypothetical protein